MSIRIGLGFDSHRIANGGVLKLGGCEVEQGRHFIAHSDGDVLLHAITDALLSAAGEPDIGQLFPNTLEENRDRSSLEMLGLAMERVRASGWNLINLDAVVQLEQPKLAPYKQAMQMRIASVLQVQTHQISLKGKTGEGTGEIGRGELATATCVALLGAS